MREAKGHAGSREVPSGFAGDGVVPPEDKSLGSGRGLAVPSPDV